MSEDKFDPFVALAELFEPSAPVGSGPWDDEPNEADWVTQIGLPAALRRSPLGHLAGYVALPEGHPLQGRDADDMPWRVHGGVTWAGVREDGRFWVGFDAGHHGDLKPQLGPEGTYRTFAYMREQCELLACGIASRGDA